MFAPARALDDREITDGFGVGAGDHGRPLLCAGRTLVEFRKLKSGRVRTHETRVHALNFVGTGGGLALGFADVAVADLI